MFKVAIVLLITLLNAFFVMAEYSLVRMRKSRLEELIQQGKSRAELVLKITESLDTYLSASQLGISVASLLLGWYCGPLLADAVMSLWNLGATLYNQSVSFVAAFFCIVLLHVVLGELVPRTVALAKVENVAMFVAYPLMFFHSVLYPIVVLTNGISHAVLTFMGINPLPHENIARSEDELRMIVSASERGGELDKMESRLIDNVFDFADRVAREVMVPRQDMVCLFTDDSLKDNLETVKATNHTRYPLCEEDKDHILGMIHVRDLMYVDPDNENFDLRSIMREIIVVPESMSIAKILQQMQHKHLQIAAVADEYGGIAGLVTMEDLLEEIVGDIQDEHDDADEPPEIVRLTDGSYEFDGMTLLDDISELLGIEFEEPEEDTIGGYIFGLLGRKPEQGDKIISLGYRFEVLTTEGFRILRVRAEKLPADESDKSSKIKLDNGNRDKQEK